MEGQTRVIVNIEKKTEYVNHYSLPIMDPDWGDVTMKSRGARRSARR
ncbi:MAG: hypothetical protein ACRDZ4_03060 [Egibacteraceae bacterium]